MPNTDHRFWHAIACQLRHPVGLGGHLTGLAMSLINRRPYAIAINALKPAAHDVIAELGFGPGSGIARLGRVCACTKLLGVERSQVMLDQAHRRNRTLIQDRRVSLALGSFTALPWPDASVDKVLAVNVAYFFDKPGLELAEVRRVMRERGTLVLYVTDSSSMANWKFASRTTHRLFDAQALQALLIEGGFAASRCNISVIDVGYRVKGLLAIAKR